MLNAFASQLLHTGNYAGIILSIIVLVLVIAWVAVKFGINITSVVLEIYHFQYNKSGIYPKFHCYPCYSQLIPYSLHIRMLCISIAMYAICHYAGTKHASTRIGATLLT